MNSVFFVIILFAIVAGFFLGRFSVKSSSDRNGEYSRPQKKVIKSIAHLLSEESDTAIETFIHDLEVSSDTIETHLALGNLLRKRGEISRAIRVHQNLIARPSLSRQEQDQSQYELAVDFIRAGLLDRAEGLLNELVESKHTEKTIRSDSLQRLLEIYIDLTDWVKAIDMADRLTTSKFAGTPDSWREVQSHLCCELAQEAIAKKDWLSARRWLRDALRYDKQCVRASLLQADLDMSDNAYVPALALLRKIPHQTPALGSEALPKIIECFQRLDSYEGMLKELRALYKENADLVTLSYLVKVLESDQDVVDLLLEELPKFSEYTSATPMLALIAANECFESTATLKNALIAIMGDMNRYLCSSCGFEGHQMHWLCPGCKHWGVVYHA